MRNRTILLALAAFLVDYSYEATRWTLARRQINAIVDNLDKPNGMLEAQKKLREIHEDLIKERNSCKATSGGR